MATFNLVGFVTTHGQKFHAIMVSFMFLREASAFWPKYVIIKKHEIVTKHESSISAIKKKKKKKNLSTLSDLAPNMFSFFLHSPNTAIEMSSKGELYL